MTTNPYLEALSPFDKPCDADTPALTRSFFTKDIYTDGLSIVKRENLPLSMPTKSTDIIRGYTLLNDAEDPETGRPVRDYYIWYALALMMLSAGDLVNAAIEVQHRYGEGDLLLKSGAWRFGFQTSAWEEDGSLSPGYTSFLDLFPVDPATVTVDSISDALVHQEGTGRYKVMGAIDATQLAVKLGSYPMLVHPKLKERSIAMQLHYNLAAVLTGDTGLQILQHWQPVDSSTGPAVYLLSDGADSYLMVYDAPTLRDFLIAVDALVGRTEQEGAIVADAQPQFLSVPADEVAELNDELNTNVDAARGSATDQEAQQVAFGQPDYLG